MIIEVQLAAGCVHDDGGGVGSIEGFGDSALRVWLGNGYFFRDKFDYWRGYAVRLTADDDDVVGLKFEIGDGNTLYESSYNTPFAGLSR